MTWRVSYSPELGPRNFFFQILVVRLSPTTATQNTRPIRLWVALQINGLIPIFFVFSNNKTQKTTFFANESPGERILRFGLCLFWHPKWVFHICTLLEAIGIVLKTHFEFEFRNRSPVGDSPNRTHGLVGAIFTGRPSKDWFANHAKECSWPPS
jgi:hypothetical protein